MKRHDHDRDVRSQDSSLLLGMSTEKRAIASVSVVIRNRNGAGTLRRVLPALRAQHPEAPQIIVVDNASTDDSVAVAVEHGATVVHLPRSEFTYGRALNLGLSHARGEVCILLSSHSLPLGPSFVEACSRPFADPAIAAIRCVHVGKPGELDGWTRLRRLTIESTIEEVVAAGPLANGCAIRRRVWESIPFDESVRAAEEKLWAIAVLAAGHVVVSGVPAFYAYLRTRSRAEWERRRAIELRAVADATGLKLSYFQQSVVSVLLWDLFAAAYEGATALKDHLLAWRVRISSRIAAGRRSCR